MRTVSKYLTFFVALAVLAISSVVGAHAQSEKRLAFVVGNANYEAGTLTTPANDAGLIAQTLQAAGFDVVGARDLDQDALRSSFRDFLGKVSTAGPDAVVFVYLAGYGLQFEGDNYFVPVDARISNAADVSIAAVRISDLTKPLAALPAKINIVVIDAARKNPFAQSNQPLAGGLALVDPDPNILIAFNATPGTVAPDGKGPYGAYAKALAEMIRDGGLPLNDVFDRTRLRVNETTQGAELPWNASRITTPFVFFDRSPDAPAPKGSAVEERTLRTKAVRDFDAHDAYTAALDRDTMRGYEDFLAAYPRDPMVRRVRAILAVRREAITWRQTWLQDLPDAYWSYLERYPHGPHAWDARRRLEHFDAALEAPQDFTPYAYEVPPPPPEEIIYVDRPVLYFDDPEFDFGAPPPVTVIFLPPPPPEFIVLTPPPPPVGIFLLPTPVFVPMPVWINAPQDVVPPPNDVIFNNIHNTTVNNTTINETTSQDKQGNGASPGGFTAGQKLTGAAVGLGAAALAARVALPPSLQKKAAALQEHKPGILPAKLGQGPKTGAGQGLPPAKATSPAKTLSTDKLSTAHVLPGANGKTLPPVNGNPPVGKNAMTLKGQPVPGIKPKSLPRQQRKLGTNSKALSDAGIAATSRKALRKNGANSATNGQANGAKFRKPSTVKHAPADGNVVNARRDSRANKLAGKQLNRPKLPVLPKAPILSRAPTRALQVAPKPQIRQPIPRRESLPRPPKPQVQGLQVQRLQNSARKKPSCGHTGEPACSK